MPKYPCWLDPENIFIETVQLSFLTVREHLAFLLMTVKALVSSMTISKDNFSCSVLPTLLLMAMAIILTSSSALAASTSFNVVDLGAKGDGRTDSTHAFLRAWDSACASSSATIYVPHGRYLLNEVLFKGQCKGPVTFKIDGTLVAPSNYHILGISGKWIVFNRVQDVSITGGILDGQGAGLWACKAAGKNCPFGARVVIGVHQLDRDFYYRADIHEQPTIPHRHPRP
ncbi:hypothetical protein Sjap_006079 [Stephania japonica]|uniref:Rhamnogalacturonase A/B/Epimerase-like pectate lyase domain-containing protein n=1 Tax=Stephania japonica TaxID=461633 RepID=A0AAP0K547_9MAGN